MVDHGHSAMGEPMLKQTCSFASCDAKRQRKSFVPLTNDTIRSAVYDYIHRGSDSCSSCSDDRHGPISLWDVSDVTDMSQLFKCAYGFNADLSMWNVSKVNLMSEMFSRASDFNTDLSKWDVSRVIDMSSMFSDAVNFNSDLSMWKVRKVICMCATFSGATVFNADLSRWDVSSVTDTGGMFGRATSFNADLSRWDVSKVTNMSNMFRETTCFNADLSQWVLSAVKYDMEGMFAEATAFVPALVDQDDHEGQRIGEWHPVLLKKHRAVWRWRRVARLFLVLQPIVMHWRVFAAESACAPGGAACVRSGTEFEAMCAHLVVAQ